MSSAVLHSPTFYVPFLLRARVSAHTLYVRGVCECECACVCVCGECACACICVCGECECACVCVCVVSVSVHVCVYTDLYLGTLFTVGTLWY